MAKSIVKRDYNSAEAMLAGVITYSLVDNPEDNIGHDIAKLIGGKGVFESLTPAGKMGVMRGFNDILGDTFASDATGFKAASTARYEKLERGELGRGGAGGGVRIGLLIEALMVIFVDKSAEDCRDWYHKLPDEEQEGLKNHKQVAHEMKKIRDKRAVAKTKSLAAEAKEAAPLVFG